jgi:hypothetical protein
MIPPTTFAIDLLGAFAGIKAINITLNAVHVFWGRGV